MTDYPKLSTKGQTDFDDIIKMAKLRILDVCVSSLGEVYVDICEHIETDAWINFRNQFVDAFMRLDTNFCGKYNLEKLAFKIAEEYPEKLAGLINDGNVKEIEMLKKVIANMPEMRSMR